MENYYSAERNVQILVALLKARGIRKIIASPGATNINFVASVQQDDFFQVYSSVDERSAAYIACGLSEESGEPVVITCTGATASRNYIPGLTEAFYRKLPILAVTSTQDISKVGHLVAQVIDRSTPLNDIVKFSVQLQNIKDDNDEWDCEVKTNSALLELRRHGGGPVHINLSTTYKKDYSLKKLPPVRVIDRVCRNDVFPELGKGRVAIFIGSHSKFSEREENAIERFCEIHDSVVFCDHTSNYKGKHRIQLALAGSQLYNMRNYGIETLIHIGEVSGDYDSFGILSQAKTVWRVSEDGEIRDFFHKLRCVFEMSESDFFEHYATGVPDKEGGFWAECREEYAKTLDAISDVPFSNVWMAKQISLKLPENSVLHLGILNSLRSWNFFELPESVRSYSNVGGFGIDGVTSSLIGASLVDPEKLYFGVIGDLAFFYDMNAVGNRHVGNNVRIMLINNGKGTEFRNFNHAGAAFGEDADKYIAAAGHYGNKSDRLVKDYAENLGYEYLSASDKDEFNAVYERFLTPTLTSRPIIFEVFTDSQDESDALEMLKSCTRNLKGRVLRTTEKIAGQFLSEDTVKRLKTIVKKIR